MARKKKIQIEKFPGIPRGAEHLPQPDPALPGARLDAMGRELPSDEPVVLHVRNRKITDLDHLRRTIQLIRATDGPVQFETFEEADDFDVDDSYGEFASRWEIPADQPPEVSAKEFTDFIQTGVIPARLFPQDQPASTGAVQVESSSAPVQGAATPDLGAGKP